MSIEAQLDAIIAELTAAKADAAKCDKGQAGTPGTRVRKVASEVSKSLKDLRAAVIAARNA
jgi:hypothetical protein